MNLSSLVISGIRTGVPIAVGYVLTLLAQSLHIVVDSNSEGQLVGLCVAVLSGAWYALARLLEKKWPNAGWLLGVPDQPSYTTRAGRAVTAEQPTPTPRHQASP